MYAWEHTKNQFLAYYALYFFLILGAQGQSKNSGTGSTEAVAIAVPIALAALAAVVVGVGGTYSVNVLPSKHF